MKHQAVSIKYTIFLFVLGILYTLYFILYTSVASAAGVALKVSPPIFQIEADPPADFRAPFTIENPTDNAVSLKIVFKPFKSSANEDGTIEYLSESDAFPGANKEIFKNMAVVDEEIAIDTLELGPGQKKQLELYGSLPKNEPLSDYYFSIIFLTQPSNLGPTPTLDNGNNSAAQAGIAINVLLSVGAKDKAKGYLEEYSVNRFFEEGPVPFTVRVQNTGSRFISPKGLILIKNMFGQTVGRVDISETNILAGTVRALTGDSKTQITISKSAAPKTIWPEKFLLGYYTATLSLALSEEGPILTRDIHFFAFPIKLLLGLIIASIIVFTLYLRLRKRLAND